MDKKGLSLVIVSRPSCFKCLEIKEIAEASDVPVKVVNFNEGGSDILAKEAFIPYIMPATIAYRDGKAIHKWSGLSEFMEEWTCDGKSM